MNNLKKLQDLAKYYTILIVDDEEDILDSMKQILEIFFKKVLTAKNGEEAIEIIKKHNVDIIITDLKMPKMDGIELAKYIKNYNADIPVIVITAFTKTEDLINLIQTGVNDYLIKPVKEDNLINVLIKQVEILHNKKFIKSFNYINIKETKIKEIKSIIIDIVNFCPYPMFAKIDNEIFFINDSCFELYKDNIKQEDFEYKEITEGIKIYRKKLENL